MNIVATRWEFTSSAVSAAWYGADIVAAEKERKRAELLAEVGAADHGDLCYVERHRPDGTLACEWHTEVAA